MKGFSRLKYFWSRFRQEVRSKGFFKAFILALKFISNSLYYYFSLSIAGIKRVKLTQADSFIGALRMMSVVYRVRDYTMLSVPRLTTLYRLGETIGRMALPGAIVECGVCNGGSAAVMTAATKKSSVNRQTWLFDSFEGLPEPSPKDDDKALTEYHEGKCLGDVARVREIFHELGILGPEVQIIEGWFEETFPAIEIREIALLHIDADWYDSVKLCLEKFYDSVQRGGFIVIDDYGHWGGCRKAADEFLKSRSANVQLLRIDYSAYYFQKS